MECKNVKALIITLPHSETQIDGLGIWELSNCFWWFGDDNYILYHHSRNNNDVPDTEYLELPKNVTKKTYKIFEYLNKGSRLILIAL